MAVLNLRAYERQLFELSRDADISDPQRQMLQEHLREVTQLRVLSDPAAIQRDQRHVRGWLETEWATLTRGMPQAWANVQRGLKQALEAAPAARKPAVN